MSTSPPLPAWPDIQEAARCISGVALRTPVVTSRTVDAHTGATVFFKCENLQRAGAFKFRGAYNALSQLPLADRGRGVLAFSSGNHAQAVALAGQLLSIPRVVVMPTDAPAVKRAATLSYGAEIVPYDRHAEDREAIGRRISEERGLTVIPPFNHPHVIAGQGTAAMELFEEVGPLDLLLVPCGGGGLLSSSALVAAALSPECRVIGVEPAAGDDATRSFRTRQLQRVENPRHRRRRRPHAIARHTHVSARPVARLRHGDRRRRYTAADDVLPVGAAEADRRANRGAWRRSSAVWRPRRGRADGWA